MVPNTVSGNIWQNYLVTKVMVRFALEDLTLNSAKTILFLESLESPKKIRIEKIFLFRRNMACFTLDMKISNLNPVDFRGEVAGRIQ